MLEEKYLNWEQYDASSFQNQVLGKGTANLTYVLYSPSLQCKIYSQKVAMEGGPIEPVLKFNQ